VRREAEEAAAAVESKRAYARQIIEHIKQVGLGMIGGQTYPYGILIHELEEKIAIDDSLGDMQDEVRTIRDATLVNIKAAMERQAERAAQQEREEEERGVAKREANQAHRAKIMKAAKEAIMTCGIDEEAAKKVVLLIRAGEVPNVSLAF
jgi:colicin import membrane protein